MELEVHADPNPDTVWYAAAAPPLVLIATNFAPVSRIVTVGVEVYQ